MDVHRPILQQLLCSFLQSLVNPGSELLASDIENHIGDILPVQYGDLSLLLWQYHLYLWIALGELQHVGDGKAVEMRNMHLTYILALDGLSLALDY